MKLPYIADWQIYWPSWWKMWPYYHETVDDTYNPPVIGWTFCFGALHFMGYRS